jgi:hypothetical protein
LIQAARGGHDELMVKMSYTKYNMAIATISDLRPAALKKILIIDEDAYLYMTFLPQ